MTVAERIQAIAVKPLEAIQGITALALALFGLYLVTPLYVPSVQSGASAAFGDDILLRIFFSFVFFVLPAVPTIISWFRSKWRTPKARGRACFYMFIGIITLTLLRVIAVGLTPPIWLFYLATGLTSAVLYLYWQVRK